MIIKSITSILIGLILIAITGTIIEQMYTKELGKELVVYYLLVISYMLALFCMWV